MAVCGDTLDHHCTSVPFSVTSGGAQTARPPVGVWLAHGTSLWLTCWLGSLPTSNHVSHGCREGWKRGLERTELGVGFSASQVIGKPE